MARLDNGVYQMNGTEYSGRSLFSGKGTVNALRNTGYKSTSHALAELVDNSIQAHATKVRIVVEVNPPKAGGKRLYINRIAVVDNGDGMDRSLLYTAILFGQGTHFEEVGGLGKFGVGLPQASLSQATRLKVWTWQDGVDHSYSTGFDISNKEWIDAGCIINDVVDEPVNPVWRKMIDSEWKSGTVVEWSGLDKITNTTESALYSNSEFLIGRMYRYWINSGDVVINYCVVERDTGRIIRDVNFRAVDPLYVMDNTSDKSLNPPVYPMFEEFTPKVIDVHWKDNVYKVTIRTSVAKPEVLKLVNKKDAAGRELYGKHAAKNIGLSIVRENRELELDNRWNGSYTFKRDPRERWWGAEISFGRELDELFGVTNDKQGATKLAAVVFDKYANHAEEGESVSDVKARLAEEEPDLNIMLGISEQIHELIKNSGKNIPDEDKGPLFDDNDTPEKKITQELKKSKEEGRIGDSDKKELPSDEETVNEIREQLTNFGTPKSEIERVVEGFLTCHYKIAFIKQELPGEDAFFSVRTDGGLLIVILNSAHAMYDPLLSILEKIDRNKNYTIDELKDLLFNAADSLKFLLAAWARMEDEASDKEKYSIVTKRRNWGKNSMLLYGIDFDE